MENKKKYFSGFDYLRAALCIFVVAWHNVIFGAPTFFHEATIDRLSPKVQDIIYFNLLLLAVPTFFQLSLFLFLRLRKARGARYFVNRIIRFSSLLIFWSAMVILYRYILGWNLAGYFSDLTQIVLTIITGGRSIFYYFFSLLFITAVAEIFFIFLSKTTRHKNSIIWISFALSLIILMVAPHIFARLEIRFDYWNPFNFIPYAFSVFLLDNFFTRENRTTITMALFLIYILFSVCDWIFIKHYIWNNYWGYIVPPYARLSVVFGAMFMLLAFLPVSHPPAKIISVLSEYSLGIYCFHKFIPAEDLCKLFAFSVPPGLVSFLVQLGGAIILTAICKKIIWLRKFV